LKAADAPTDTFGILHLDLVTGGPVSIGHFEAAPRGRNARLQHQLSRADLQSQDPLESRAVHPARRARVPRPAAAAFVGRYGINVRGDHVRLDPVTLHVRG